MAQRPGQQGRFLYLELGPFSVPGRYANHAHHSYFAAHLSGTESGPGSWAAGAKEGAWCERVLATIPNRNAIAAQQAGPLFVPGSWAVFLYLESGPRTDGLGSVRASFVRDEIARDLEQLERPPPQKVGPFSAPKG